MADKIGKAILDIEFSPDEKDRIGSFLLDKDSLHTKIVLTKAPLISNKKFWISASKRFEVTGFRVATPAAIKVILHKAINGLKTKPGAKNENIWLLYRRSVPYYVGKELANLNQLLHEEDLEVGSDDLTTAIFKNIAKKAPYYQVTDEEIRQLYDIWGFDRIGNFDSLLNSPLTIDTVQHLVKLEYNKLSLANNSELAEIKKSLNIKIENSEIKLNEFKSLIKESERKFTSSMNYIKENFELPSHVAALNKIVKLQDEKIESIENKLLSMKEAIDSKLHLLNERLTKEIQIIGEKIENVKTSDTSIKLINKPNNPPLMVAELLKKWVKIWGHFDIQGVSQGANLCIFSLLRRGNLFIVDRPEIIMLLLREIPGIVITNITASPLWLSESDWSDHIQHFEKSSSLIRILVLSDFDVGIQETYLIPVLNKWLLSENLPNIKIILIPSRNNSSQINNRLLETAITLDFNLCTMDKIIRFSERIEPTITTLEILNDTLPQDFCSTRIISLNGEKDLKRLLQDDSLPLPLLSNFVNIQDEFRKLFPENQSVPSIDLIASFTLYPWIRAVKGCITSRNIEKKFEALFGRT